VKLIEAVAKRPVLYNVDLVDYKNKNKKGEGFKEVQNEMREAGASEAQVQAIYKKWISIKRKFRVEYLRTKSDEENGRIPSTTYPYYESLKFLIPYCEFYKVCSQAQKRRNNFFEEESDEERGIQEDDDFPSLTPQSTLDFLINQQKRVKLETQVSELVAAMNAATSNNNLEDSEENQTLFNSTSSSSTSTTPTKRNKTSSNESTSSIDLPASASPTASPLDESQNSLFGQLVARELDKLPTGVHNLMRAQILFLIAQTSQNLQTPNSNTSGDRLMASLGCFLN